MVWDAYTMTLACPPNSKTGPLSFTLSDKTEIPLRERYRLPIWKR